MSGTPPPPWSQPTQPSNRPPPPPSAVPPPPPPTPLSPPIETWGQTKPPRPRCPVGAILMIAGAVVMIVGSFLTWVEFPGLTVTGFAESDGELGDGPIFLTIGVILIGFGITTLAARRILPIAILAVVFAAFGVLGSIADLSNILDARDLLGDQVTLGPGLPVVLIGALASLAGGIVALATRRR